MRFAEHQLGVVRGAVASAVIAFSCLACGNEATTGSGQGGTAAGTTSGSGGGAGGVGGWASSGGIGACDGVDQASVTIPITNQLAESRYIIWTATQSGLSTKDPLRYERQVGGQWEPVPFAQPDGDCEATCSEENEGSNTCCMNCGGASSAMRLLNPGESVERWWTGKRYVEDSKWCDCTCHWVCSPKTGHYRVLVDVYGAIDCGTNPCAEPTDYGVIENATPEGEPTTYSAEFDVLYDQPELALLIQ